MKPKYFPMLGSLLAFTAAGPLLVPLPASAQTEQAEANEDVEVLTRGPVHEAFAETVSYEAEAGLTVKSAPPAAIEELPPDQRPDGDNVTWIPGYWAWDDDKNDFLWISGIWRNIPPDRQWVPGYWNDLGDTSFQWISGYWADTTTDEVEYVEAAPPKSIDSGPNIAAPSDDQTWVPGNWMWNESRYVWRPGYWLPLRPNWTWVPARYNYSPRGYVFVDGYWDYAVASRGVLFAPVYYRRHVWSDPGYYYTPSIVVSLNLFTDHLFIRPRCGHYYFGDYYAPRYADLGFYSGFSWHRHHRGYDPIWAYNRWDHRHDRDWERRYEDNYNFFRTNDRFRPPHTWAAMRALGDERLEGGRTRNFARSFDSLVKDPDRVQQFRPVDKDRREKLVAQRQEMREFSRQRREMEAKPVAAIADRSAQAGEGEKVKKGGAFREKLRRSPVVSREAGQLAAKENPPKRPEGRGNKALKDAAAAAAATGDDNTAGRGKGREGRDMVQRQTEGDSVKPDRGPAGQGKGKGKADGTDEPKVTQNDRERRVPGKDTDGKPERQVQPKPEREKATPEREVQPKPEREKAKPERQVQPKPEREKAAPERQVQPKPQREKAAPERQVQPKPQPVQPKRQVVPERKAQPERQAQPRQPQVKPEKKQGKDKDSASVAPQRRPESSVQRVAQPKPQVRRQAQPQQQQAQPKPQQRQVQPRQQQAQPKPQQRQVQPRQQQAQPKPQQRQAQPRQQQAQPKPQQRQVQPQQQKAQPQQRQNKKDRDKKDDA